MLALCMDIMYILQAQARTHSEQKNTWQTSRSFGKPLLKVSTCSNVLAMSKTCNTQYHTCTKCSCPSFFLSQNVSLPPMCHVTIVNKKRISVRIQTGTTMNKKKTRRHAEHVKNELLPMLAVTGYRKQHK